ncbi:hypothetical protein [Kocuria arenosa]|uniref:hypothetical protein n=1 Tax=Kocuria arenosa TaxID=3071446 RepID=UPI0034D76896
MTTTASFDHPTPREYPAPTLAAPMIPAPSRTPGSRLGPEEDFPQDLTALGMAELQVLHSRITRQLDHDYLTDPAGPHPVTMDRGLELAAELDARDTA